MSRIFRFGDGNPRLIGGLFTSVVVSADFLGFLRGIAAGIWASNCRIFHEIMLKLVS